MHTHTVIVYVLILKLHLRSVVLKRSSSPSFPKATTELSIPQRTNQSSGPFFRNQKGTATKKWYKVLEGANDCLRNLHRNTRWPVRRGICLWKTLAQRSRDCQVLGQEEDRGFLRKKRNSLRIKSDDRWARNKRSNGEMLHMPSICTYKTREEEDDEDDTERKRYLLLLWMNWFYVLYLLNQNAYRYNNNHDERPEILCNSHCISSAYVSTCNKFWRFFWHHSHRG